MKTNNQLGFTTLELAMVIVMFGMVSSTFLYGLQEYSKQQDRAQTKEAITTVEAAISEFKSIYGRYPCPANPALPMTHPMAGRENCGTATTTLGRDANKDGAGDQVVKGTVPFKTLVNPDNNPATDDGIKDVPLSANLVIDGWGNQLTYAVTRSMTNSTTFNDFLGAINVIDENNNTVLQEPGSAHLVVLSHGKNGRGAYTKDGRLVQNCTNGLVVNQTVKQQLMGGSQAHPGTQMQQQQQQQQVFSEEGVPVTGGGMSTSGTTVSGAQVSGSVVVEGGATGGGGNTNNVSLDETQNCNNDATYLSGLYSEGSQKFNDDYTRYKNTSSSGLWRYVGLNKVSNSNPGGVGIGIANPSEKLHIAGDMKAINVFARTICDNGGQDCLPASVLGGNDPNMRCPGQNQVVTGIQGNRVICGTAFTAGVGQLTCPPGSLMTGISNVTGVICIASSNANTGGGYNWNSGGVAGSTDVPLTNTDDNTGGGGTAGGGVTPSGGGNSGGIQPEHTTGGVVNGTGTIGGASSGATTEPPASGGTSGSTGTVGASVGGVATGTTGVIGTDLGSENGAGPFTPAGAGKLGTGKTIQQESGSFTTLDRTLSEEK